MELNELIQQPEIQAFRPQLEAKGIDFKLSVAEAQKKAENRQYIAANPDQSEIILYVVDFLLKLISENAKPKRKFWQVVFSVLPAIGNAIGSVFSKKK